MWKLIFWWGPKLHQNPEIFRISFLICSGNRTQKSGKFPETKHQKLCLSGWATQPVSPSMAKVIPDSLLCLPMCIFWPIAQNCIVVEIPPSLSYLIQKVHLKKRLHNNKHICYIYASLWAQIPKCATPAAWAQSIRAQHLMLLFRKPSGFLCTISTTD